MFNFKTIAAATLALSSSAVFSGTMGPVCTPGNVTVPCERTAWDVGIQALYLKPSYSAEYGYSPFVQTIDGWAKYEPRNSDWDWGFRIEASYHFSTGNDLTVNWMHYDKSDDYVQRIDPFVFEPLNSPGHTFFTTINPKFDAINAELGQYVDFSQVKSIRFHGGVQWARIEHDISAIIDSGTPSTANRSFNGFGPRAGADMTYHFSNGFGVYANAATTILVGTSKFNLTAPGVAAFLGSKNAIVPAVEAKLGAKYVYAMAQGDLMIDGGWLFMNYFNANHGITNPLVPVVTETDFALNGPYIGLKYVGNV